MPPCCTNNYKGKHFNVSKNNYNNAGLFFPVGASRVFNLKEIKKAIEMYT